MNKKEKDKFLKEINSIPYWVKNEDDLKNFCKHIQFRLFQAKEKLKIFDYHMNTIKPETNIFILEEVNLKHLEIERIYNQQDDDMEIEEANLFSDIVKIYNILEDMTNLDESDKIIIKSNLIINFDSTKVQRLMAYVSILNKF